MHTVKIYTGRVICHSFITSFKRLLTFLALFLPFLRPRASVSRGNRYFQNTFLFPKIKKKKSLLLFVIFIVFRSVKINLYFAHAGLSRHQGRQGNSITYYFQARDVACICFLFSCRTKDKQTNTTCSTIRFNRHLEKGR